MPALEPAPGSPEELARFAALQERLGTLFARVFPDPRVPRTVVVLPSLSLDQDVIANIKGLPHYEERMLCMLLLLRLPNTCVIYVTGMPVDPSIVDYYLHLLPGVPGRHARRRLVMLTCHDDSAEPVASKVLGRPRMIRRLREAIVDPPAAHMTCFTVTDLERTLAVQLGIPIFGCDPSLAFLGSKSGSRAVFEEAGILVPPGVSGLRDMRDVGAALAELRRRDPGLHRAAVKLDYGTSGEGNAVFRYEGCPKGSGVEQWVREELPARLEFSDECQSWDRYAAQYATMGGVVEAWIEGPSKRSPSMQGRVDPLGRVELISTHDQVLGGPSNQKFLGSRFPADEAYRTEIQDVGLRVGRVLRRQRALGRFGVDFVSVPTGDGWVHYAIEINLRKGGTTHTFRILQLLTDGRYDGSSGLFITPQGNPRYYLASDNVENPVYRRLTPDDLMDVAVQHRLHFHGPNQEGVFFHLIGALSGYGKFGLVCVAGSPDRADMLYRRTVRILDAEAES